MKVPINHQLDINAEILELRNKVDFYKTIADNTYHWEILMSCEGRFKYVSPSCETITGYKAEEFINNQNLFEEIVFSEDKIMVIDYLQDVLNNIIDKKHLKFRITTKNGKIKWINHLCKKAFNNQGKLIGYRSSNSDISEIKKTELNLKESEEKFRSTIYSINDLVFVLNKEGKFIEFYNPAKTDSLYIPPEHFINKHYKQVGLPEYVTCKIEAAINSILNNEIFQTFDYSLKMGNETHWYNAQISKKVDHLNNYNGVTVVARDITTRKLAEKALKLNEQKLEFFFEQSLDGFSFMTLDKPISWNESVNKEEALDYIFNNLQVSKINKAMQSQYGYHEKKILGKTPANFFGHNIEYGKQVYKNFLDNGKIHINTDERRADGSQMWVEGFYICIYNEEGQITGQFGIQRDISEKKKAEVQLKEINRKLKEAQKIGCIGDWTNNLTTKETSWSGEAFRIFGYSRKEAKPKDIFKNHMLPEDLNKFKNDYKELISKSERLISKKEYKIYSKNGQQKYVAIQGVFVYNKDGKKEKAFGTIKDITEEKENELKLKELNATKDRFFSIIAHDLKNPFNTIIGFSELLMNCDPDFFKENARNYTQLINTSAQKSYGLLVNLLEWSHSQSGKLKLIPEQFNISELIFEIYELLKVTAIEKKLSVEIQVPAETKLYADKNMLSTVIRNLLSNAIKFTHTNGSIIIKGNIKDSGFKFSITDTGVGIEQENISKLFRIDTSYSTNGTNEEEGSGIGLILCYDFITKHRGKIWAESTIGTGSSFSFWIPMVKTN